MSASLQVRARAILASESPLSHRLCHQRFSPTTPLQPLGAPLHPWCVANGCAARSQLQISSHEATEIPTAPCSEPAFVWKKPSEPVTTSYKSMSKPANFPCQTLTTWSEPAPILEASLVMQLAPHLCTILSRCILLRRQAGTQDD